MNETHRGADASAVWYVRESHDVAVSCMLVYGDRYLDARYVWRDHVDHGAARGDTVLFGNGTMFLESAELTDSDTYRCHVDLPDHTTEVYTHSVIGKIRASVQDIDREFVTSAKTFANFNEFSEIKKIRKNSYKIR